MFYRCDRNELNTQVKCLNTRHKSHYSVEKIFEKSKTQNWDHVDIYSDIIIKFWYKFVFGNILTKITPT